jgi:hypothetical protein
MAWTDEAIETMKRMTLDGCSASVIAAELGTTRNAVIGKQHRIGAPTNSNGGPRRPVLRKTAANSKRDGYVKPRYEKPERERLWGPLGKKPGRIMFLCGLVAR